MALCCRLLFDRQTLPPEGRDSPRDSDRGPRPSKRAHGNACAEGFELDRFRLSTGSRFRSVSGALCCPVLPSELGLLGGGLLGTSACRLSEQIGCGLREPKHERPDHGEEEDEAKNCDPGSPFAFAGTLSVVEVSRLPDGRANRSSLNRAGSWRCSSEAESGQRL